MKKTDIHDEVEIMLVGGTFHLPTDNPKYEFYPRRKIPKRLWDLHNKLQPKAIDVQRRIMQYFKPIKDKPMLVVRNHVKEGEIHSFGDNGELVVKITLS
jgi:hypothetical protein